MAVALLDVIGLMMFLPLLPLYALRLHAVPATIGFLTASFPVAQLASSPIWGRVSDRYGRRPVLLVGLAGSAVARSEEHTSELQSRLHLVCRLLLEKKKKKKSKYYDSHVHLRPQRESAGAP